LGAHEVSDIDIEIDIQDLNRTCGERAETPRTGWIERERLLNPNPRRAAAAFSSVALSALFECPEKEQRDQSPIPSKRYVQHLSVLSPLHLSLRMAAATTA
jgi:hypothetical protein